MKGLAIGAAMFVGASAAAVGVGIWGDSLPTASEQQSAGIVVAVLAFVAVAGLAGLAEEAQILWRNRRHPCTCRGRRLWQDHRPWCRRSWR